MPNFNKGPRLALCYGLLALLAWPFMLHPAGQQLSPDPANPPTTGQIVTYVVVRDISGRPVNSLTQENFSLFDDGVRRPITTFSDQPVPASVAVLFDLSRSTPADALGQAVRAFSLLRRESLKANDYLVATFSERDELIADWTNEDDVLAAALNKVTDARRRNDTALFDALYATVERMNTARHRRRVIILFSDGLNNASRRQGFKEVRELLKHSDATLYVIGVNLSAGSSYITHAQEQMSELAWGSGGAAFFLSLEAKSYSYEQPIYDAFAYIATDLRYHYTLGFEPGVGSGRRWHPVTISVEHPEIKARKAKLFVQARKGHYESAHPRQSP